MNKCWIHLENLKFFIFLGNTQAEQLIGQNITIHISLCIPYKNTQDDVKNTVDYGRVYECIAQKIKQMKKVKLLEYLLEQLFLELENNFSNIISAKIMIKKGYVPLKNFTGSAKIEGVKNFNE